MMKNGFSISHFKSFMSLRSMALFIAVAMIAFALNTSPAFAHLCNGVDDDHAGEPDCFPTISLAHVGSDLNLVGTDHTVKASVPAPPL